MKEEDLGVAILSTLKETGSLESHLLIAVTSDDLRGKYECFSSADSNEALETFFIGSKNKSLRPRPVHTYPEIFVSANFLCGYT